VTSQWLHGASVRGIFVPIPVGEPSNERDTYAPVLLA